jgi:hypothetical protein
VGLGLGSNIPIAVMNAQSLTVDRKAQRRETPHSLRILGGRRRSDRLLQPAIDLAQFPEDCKKKNRDNKQQELHVHICVL